MGWTGTGFDNSGLISVPSPATITKNLFLVLVLISSYATTTSIHNVSESLFANHNYFSALLL